MSARQGRIAKKYDAAKTHFKNVAGQIKGKVEAVKGKVEQVKSTVVSQLQKSNLGRISKHAMKQRAADAGAAAKKQTKVKQNVPAPAPRRGR